MNPSLNEILDRHGRKFDFSTCKCAICYGQREVEKRSTTRQALHTIMGADLAESVIKDMGPQWAIVAALADPNGDGTAARAALVEISKAGIEFDRPAPKDH